MDPHEELRLVQTTLPSYVSPYTYGSSCLSLIGKVGNAETRSRFQLFSIDQDGPPKGVKFFAETLGNFHTERRTQLTEIPSTWICVDDSDRCYEALGRLDTEEQGASVSLYMFGPWLAQGKREVLYERVTVCKKEYFLYLLTANEGKNTYVGITECVFKRLMEHNDSFSVTKSTHPYSGAWNLHCFVKAPSKIEAHRMEKNVKSKLNDRNVPQRTRNEKGRLKLENVNVPLHERIEDYLSVVEAEGLADSIIYIDNKKAEESVGCKRTMNHERNSNTPKILRYDKTTCTENSMIDENSVVSSLPPIDTKIPTVFKGYGCFDLKIPLPIRVGPDGGKFINVRIRSNKVTIDQEENAIRKAWRSCVWTPESSLKNTQIWAPVSWDDCALNFRQIIGVVIVQAFGIYVKLYYDPESEFGVSASDNYFSIVESTHYHADFEMGVDFLIVHRQSIFSFGKGKVKRIEAFTESDTQ
jgi:predicted GIY-YIG superfamily endonuclease